MVTVRIIIRGIALAYFKQGQDIWKVLFPFDDCHLVKFKLSENEAGVPLAGTGRQIRIRAENPTSAFEIGDNFGEFLDITSKHSHQNGIKPKGSLADKSVLLSIENAKFSVFEFTRCRFQLMDDENVTIPPKVIGYSGKAEITGEKVIVEAEGVSGFPKTFDQDGLIIFDNICPRNLEEQIGPDGEIHMLAEDQPSDFEKLYEIVEDASEPDKKFVVDRDPTQKPGAVEAVFTGFSFQDNVVEGEPGLPCNIFVASVADSLP
ncbi:MAG TPA: hypothetical protein VNB22_00845 [Pyrinomonadaceae bacterium]|jgi:hypothetical protein|nr:hypothetical protein [Pyrinomonadaceae bacterium]